jgi:hypothetical protein
VSWSGRAGAGTARARPQRATIRRRLATGAALALVGPALWLGPLAGQSRAAVTVNLDQWASLDKAWQNGNLNGNNSRYPEGGIVPFRLALEGLSAGNHEIKISYDFTAGGHKAYDFLATWNATNAGGAICLPSGGAISSMCPSLPSVSTYPLPSDPFKTDGLTVSGAQAYAGMPRRLSIWGGTVLSITSPVHTGSASGNSDVELVVRFKSSGAAVLLAWGGHLAQSSYWNSAGGGERDGASLVSGAPWHVRTLGLDGAGSKNQDRSIQPSAIVGELPPGGGLAPTPPPGQPPAGPAGPGVTPPDTAGTTRSQAFSAPNVAELLVLLAVAGLCLLVLVRGSPARRRA